MSEQLTSWLAGHPIHNEQCCPDFSCCRAELLASKEQRERFCKAVSDGDDSTRMEMLGMFLGAAMNTKEVYVAGLDPEGQDQ